MSDYRKKYTERGQRYRITVEPKLHYIRGNSAPYFSITADIRRSEGGIWREYSGGCCHEEIERQFPGQFSDLIAMHLSDMDGAPMHAEANGWYWLAGMLGGMGERYHGGNQEAYGRDLDARAIFARHCRITLDEADTIAATVKAELGPMQEEGTVSPWKRSDYDRAKRAWTGICEGMRPRWKQEADACIARHNLTVTGDAWVAA